MQKRPFLHLSTLPSQLPSTPPIMSPSTTIIFLTTFILLFSSHVNSQPFDYPTANLSTSWTNSVSAPHSVPFTDNSTVRAILLRGTFAPRYACGFFCNGVCDTYLFAMFIVQTNSGGGITSPNIGFPQVVWSANRNHPVRINATLNFTSDGNLVLTDVDGTIAWSTNTSGMSVSGMNLTETGNLILHDSRSSVVWQSFDHPTDALVPGQRLFAGQNLTASVSSTNWTDGGLIALSMTGQGLVASVGSDQTQQVYRDYLYNSPKMNREVSYAKFENGSIQLYVNSTEPNDPDLSISVPPASSAQYLRLGPDGHFRLFEWSEAWTEVADVFLDFLGMCNYPVVCGKYGICSNGQCTCPKSNPSSFVQVNDRSPDLGCLEVNRLTCDASSNHSFLDLEDVTYFDFVADISSTSLSSCKEACMRNCSCKAAIFRYGSDSANGECYLPSDVFSLMNNEKDKTHYNSSVSIKVQMASSGISPQSPVQVSNDRRKKSVLGPVLGSTVGIVVAVVLVFLVVFAYKKKRKAEDVEEDYLDHVPGMPTRFSYEELVSATENFNKKLGEGGFGSVFEGSLKDGTKIAVKCLDGIGQIKKSFLAEVETIGSIHHVNLVRLIGFCADKSHRLLVYEFMCNGSLDRWIYRKDEESTILDWNQRRKIILGIAKGLSYLHEDCRQKIIHLDIKPQNILLDENYNAKLADFGLSKLIDRNQSQVVTTMRGTPGYLAPEWLSAVITEKVDVYSFGVVVLEIVCGRRNFEQSKPENEKHLLSLFKKKAEEGQWLDIIDKFSADMVSNGPEVVEMMQIAAWCLQSDYANRPSMSTVMKVLEGVKDVEKDLDYNFINPKYLINQVPQISSDDGTPLIPSVLSGPR